MIDFYCIYKKNDIQAELAQNEAQKSAQKYKINLISYPGIYQDIDKHIETEKLFIHASGSHKITRRGKGVLGCFLSHYFLWKKCLETDSPLGVLEYDAVFINNIPENIEDQFEDYLNLDFTRHIFLKTNSKYKLYLKEVSQQKNNKNLEIKSLEERQKKNNQTFKYINNNHIKGAFGYIIKPSGAKKLIDATKKYGILPADVQPNLRYINVQYTCPSLVMLNPNGLESRYGGSHTNSDFTK